MNEFIKVKLKKSGYDLLAENHNQYIGVIKGWRKRTYKHYQKKADKDGYTRFLFWEFMKEFGPTLSLGMEPLFDLEIRFEVNE